MKESFSGYYYEKKHRVKKKKIQMLPEESADIMEQQILDTLSLHMARPNGRFCGAKRPKCEAEQPLGFD